MFVTKMFTKIYIYIKIFDMYKTRMIKILVKYNLSGYNSEWAKVNNNE
jgi:hypothetical protein